MVSGIIFAQEDPNLEAIDQQVEATYFFENGTIHQIGKFKDGKLDGKWISYSENGDIKAIAQYKEGVKNGKWQFFEAANIIKEVDYNNNNIEKIKIFNDNPIADSN
jgi:antitoxin component YwqK of YwqJK toxin-antitoxin module